MSYIVTQKGPIDRHPPGTNVSKLYPADVLVRLVAEGYVEDTDAPKEPSKKKVGK